MIFEAGRYARSRDCPAPHGRRGHGASSHGRVTCARSPATSSCGWRFALAESGYPHLRPSFGPLLERLRDGALPVGQVATALDVSPQAASRDAQMLERFGYVARAASAVDGRSRVVALTDRGDDLIGESR